MTEARASEAEKAKQVRRVVAGSKRSPAAWAALAIVAVAAIALGIYWWKKPPEQTMTWRTEAVDRGDILMTATATGNLKPRSQIAIGAEVSGRIEEVLVTFNDIVEEGQLLATFDTEALDNALEQAQLGLNVASADLRRARATLQEAKASLARTEQLAGQGSAAANTLDTARAQAARAEADVAASSAQYRIAQTRVDLAKTNLSRARILSPIKGVVLERNVEPGNTVAASLQTPQLFLLAEDLTKMELHVAIDEADVGLVKSGQSATFTVDAWPDQTFNATVQTVYLAHTLTGSVITYTAVLQVDNPDQLLRPGMTAMTTITTITREDALRVPNAALRYSPPRPESGGAFSLGPTPRMRGMGGRRGGGGSEASSTVWVLRGAEPERVNVRVGRSDGRYTEILGGEIKEGDALVVGQRPVKAPSEEAEADNDARSGARAPRARREEAAATAPTAPPATTAPKPAEATP